MIEAAVRGKEDRLVGLKENVVIGRLIPAYSLEDKDYDLGKKPDIKSDVEEDLVAKTLQSLQS